MSFSRHAGRIAGTSALLGLLLAIGCLPGGGARAARTEEVSLRILSQSSLQGEVVPCG